MLARPGCLCSNQLNVELISDPAGNFVLESQQIADVAVQPLRPYMRVGCSIDQLGADADLGAPPPDASFEHIADTQLATNLLCVDWLVPVREGGIARDHEHVREARQIRG